MWMIVKIAYQRIVYQMLIEGKMISFEDSIMLFICIFHHHHCHLFFQHRYNAHHHHYHHHDHHYHRHH